MVCLEDVGQQLNIELGVVLASRLLDSQPKIILLNLNVLPLYF